MPDPWRDHQSFDSPDHHFNSAAGILICQLVTSIRRPGLSSHLIFQYVAAVGVERRLRGGQQQAREHAAHEAAREQGWPSGRDSSYRQAAQLDCVPVGDRVMCASVVGRGAATRAAAMGEQCR